MPHDKLPRGHKVCKYVLTVVDVASRYKEAEPLTSKNSDEVAKAFQTIYRRSPLTWPEMLQVDPGREFMGAVTKKWTSIKHISSAGALKFTATRPLLNVSLLQNRRHLIQGLLGKTKKYSRLLSKFVISTNPASLKAARKEPRNPIWSLKVYSIERSFTKPEQPVLYYLRDGPKRGFVCEELLVVPPNTQLPTEQI